MKAILVALRASPHGRLALALLAVPAILIGLLAMHVLTTGNMADTADHHSSVSLAAAAVDEMAMAPSSESGSLADDCGGVCMPAHDMLGMMCVLALLAGVILFALQLALTGWPTLMRILRPLRLTVAALAPPNPPSLHVLSISRT